MRSRWLASSLGLCLALLPCSLARAASLYDVTISVQYNGPGSEGAITVDDSAGFTSLGAVYLLVAGATGFAPNLANPGISVLDSGLNLNVLPPYSLLFVNNTAYGVAIAPLGATTLLGTVQFGSSAPSIAPAEDPSFGYSTFYDVNLQPLVPFQVSQANGPVCGEPPCPPTSVYALRFTFLVPEPEAAAGLAAVALALLALARGGAFAQ